MVWWNIRIAAILRSQVLGMHEKCCRHNFQWPTMRKSCMIPHVAHVSIILLIVTGEFFMKICMCKLNKRLIATIVVGFYNNCMHLRIYVQYIIMTVFIIEIVNDSTSN